MKLRRFALLSASLSALLLALPASAESEQPQIEDVCGDATSHAEFNGEGTQLEQNRSYLDIASGLIQTLRGPGGDDQGVQATITVCGVADAAQGGYDIGWSYGDGCHGDLTWTLTGRNLPDGGEGIEGYAKVTDNPRGELTETCYEEPESPLDSGVHTIYRYELPAESITFDGATLSFTIRRADLPAAAAPRFLSDTVWSDVGVVAMDQGPSTWAGYGDTNGNRGNLFVRTDFALGGDSYVVGSD